jgi:hypothetical protein
LLRQVQKLTRDQSLSKLEGEDAEAGYCYYEREIDERLSELNKNMKKPGEPANEERRCFTGYPGFDAPDEVRNENLVSYKRKREQKGPLTVFGYDYFADHAKAVGVAMPRLLSYEGLWGTGEEYAYEVLNLVDTVHSRVRIWENVSAEYGPIPYEMVVEYLKALEKIGVVAEVK